MASVALAGTTLVAKAGVARQGRRRSSVNVNAAAYNGAYAEELVATAVSDAAGFLTWCRCLQQRFTLLPPPLAEQDRHPWQGHPG